MSAWTGEHAETLHAFEEAAQAFVDLVGQVRGDWDRPGLGVWDLRSLVGHCARALVTVTTYLDRPAASEDLASAAAYLGGSGAVDPRLVAERGRQAGADLGDDPAARVAQTAARAVDRVRSADPDALVQTVNGGMRVAAYLPTRTFELVVHSADIATALGLEPDAPPAALREAARLATQVVLDQGRGNDLLLTLTGRADWPADLVVIR
jgi:uncharacterized protein (TIGR03083 family)